MHFLIEAHSKSERSKGGGEIVRGLIEGEAECCIQERWEVGRWGS